MTTFSYFRTFMMWILRRNIARFLLSNLVLGIIFRFKQNVVFQNRFCFVFQVIIILFLACFPAQIVPAQIICRKKPCFLKEFPENFKEIARREFFCWESNRLYACSLVKTNSAANFFHENFP